MQRDEVEALLFSKELLLPEHLCLSFRAIVWIAVEVQLDVRHFMEYHLFVTHGSPLKTVS